MKNKLAVKLAVFLILTSMNLQAQAFGYIATGNNTIQVQTEEYIINSPTSTVGNRKNMLVKKDSTIWENRWTTPSFTKFSSSRNDGNVTGFLFTDSFGYIKHSPKSQLTLDYSQINNKPVIPTNNNQLLNGSGYITAEVDGSTTNELQTLSITGNNISISSGNSISLPQPTISIATRSLNTNFTPSATRNTLVSYSVNCQVQNPLLIGTSSATAFLEYSINGGTTWLNPSQVGNSSGVGITVTVQLTNAQTGTLVGVIPANALTRIRTATVGTGTVTYVTGTEINL